jgi:C-terminal processing protease CtpA/Prc
MTRTTPALLGAGVALCLASCAPPGLPDPTTLDTSWTRHVDAIHGVALRRPAGWDLQDADQLRYGGPDGWFRLADWDGPEADAEAAAQALAAKIAFPGAAIEAVRIDGADARLVFPRWPALDRGWALVPYPAPIKRTFAERTATLAVFESDRAHARPLVASWRFARDPADYLESGLGLLERFSFKRQTVDWAEVRAAAQPPAGTDATLGDVQAGMARAVGAIADRHSFFLPPRETEQFFAPGATGTGYVAEDLDGRRVVVRVYADSPAAKAGMATGDVILRHEAGGAPGAERLTLTRPGAPPEHVVELVPGNYATTLQPIWAPIAPGVAYVELPDTVANANYDPYRQKLAAVLAEADAAGARRWILDVRRNSGGSHWAMIAPLAPLVGEGVFGGLEGADGKRTLYAVRGNQVYEDDAAIDPDLPPPHLARAAPPVAVLAGPLSASAAEAVILAFVGRPDARVFGAPSLGVPTSNTAFEFWDGAFLNLATYKGLDRLGRAWDAPIPPETWVETRWEAFATPQDPAVAAALSWLEGR